MKDLWIQRRLSRHLEREGVVTLANGVRNKSPTQTARAKLLPKPLPRAPFGINGPAKRDYSIG